MVKQTRSKKRSQKKGSRKVSRKGRKRVSRKGKATRKVQRKVKPTTKYKTGDSDDYEGACKQEKVQECVDQGKYCNVDTNKCIAPTGVKAKVKKDATIAVDPSYGVVGKTQAVNNIKKYLEKLSASKQKKLDIGISTKISEESPVPKKKKKAVPKKAAAKKAAAKKAAPKKAAKKKSCQLFAKCVDRLLARTDRL